MLNESRLATLGGDRCPVCGTPVVPAIDAGPFRLFACDTCRSWCSDARFRQAQTSFAPLNYFARADTDREKWEDLLARLDRHATKPGSVLDVGCGTGAFLSYLRKRLPGAARFGVELDPVRAREAMQSAAGATIHCGDAASLADHANTKFDLITLWDVLEHVPDPGRLLAVLREHLSTDGRLFIQTIHEQSLLPRIGRWSYRLTGGRIKNAVRRTHDAHHIVFFSRAGLGMLAKAAGLEVVDVWFDRLARARMDGPALLTAATALALAVENAAGNGLFINLLLMPRRDSRGR